VSLLTHDARVIQHSQQRPLNPLKGEVIVAKGSLYPEKCQKEIFDPSDKGGRFLLASELFIIDSSDKYLKSFRNHNYLDSSSYGYKCCQHITGEVCILRP
jgi:hypothetical protein